MKRAAPRAFPAGHQKKRARSDAFHHTIGKQPDKHGWNIHLWRKDAPRARRIATKKITKHKSRRRVQARLFPAQSEGPQPGFEFIVCHHVVGRQHTFFRQENDPPVQTGAALEQILSKPPNSEPGMQVGVAKAIGQCAQGFRNLFLFRGAQFPHALPKAWMKIDSHSLPLKGFVWPDARALRTSVFTAWNARSACFSVMPYSCRA